MKRAISAGLAIVFIVATNLAAAQDGPPGLDASCDGLEGAERGACVAQLAQERSTSEQANPIAEAAQQLVDGCRDLTGEEFGACVSDAARALTDTGAPI